jgi:hypothetical protein
MTTLNTQRTYGVEFEGFGIDKSVLVRKLREAGINAYESSYSGSDYTVWQVKSDASIRGHMGFEIVSPVLQGQHGLEQIKTALRVVRENGGDANRSCGFHIHWGVADWGVREFRNFYKRWAKFEQGIDLVQPKSRRGDNAQYCRSVYHSVFAGHSTRGIKENTSYFFNMIDNCNSIRAIEELTQPGWTGRYRKLNMKKFHRTGTIEVRHASGTFDEQKALSWISLTGSMIADADNKKAVKTWAGSVDAKKALDTLLGAAVRVGGIDAATRTYFKNRAKQLAS